MNKTPRSTRTLRIALAMFVAVAAVVWFGAPAQAADGTVVRQVDTTAFPKVEVTVMRPPGAPAGAPVTATEDGKQVQNLRSQSLEAAGKKMGTILVIDTSEAMLDGAALDKTKTAAKALVAAKQGNEEFAIVTTNGGARVTTTYTSNQALLDESIDRLTAVGDSAVNRGIQIAAGLAGERSDLQSNILVVAGGPDGLSRDGTLADVRSTLRSSDTSVFVVGVAQRRAIDAAALGDLATASGGRIDQTKDANKIGDLVSAIGQDLRSQSVVTFDARAKRAVNAAVSIAGSTDDFRVAANTISEGANVQPAKSDVNPVYSFLGNNGALLVVVLVVFAGVLLLVYGLYGLVSRERGGLNSALRAYSDTADEEKKDISKLADSEIIKKAIASTSKIAEERGILERLQRKLEQADLALKPAEALFFTALVAAVAMLLGAAFAGIIGLFAAGVVFGFMPVAFLNFKARARRKKFTSQLPDVLTLLAGSLRAGYSLIQGIDAVSQQCEAPMSLELQRALSEARLGRPVEEALQDISDRVGSDDFEWTVMAIKIQREVGGNLAELLMTVANTMVERERLRREVLALTAEGRISSIILSALPPVIAGVIFFINPTYMDPMLEQWIGQALLVVAGFMIIIGYIVMKKMTEIEA